MSGCVAYITKPPQTALIDATPRAASLRNSTQLNATFLTGEQHDF
jgi:hypothetical protein